MKKLSILFISLVLLTSCGGKEPTVDELLASGDLKTIAAKKTALLNEKVAINDQIKNIEDYLDKNGTKKANTLISVLKVTDTVFNHFIELQGSVDTKQNITLTPEMPGILMQVYVKEGQKVSAGQLLARIDDGGISQQIQQMQVQEQLAKTTFDRQKRLWDQKIGSEIQYLQAKANYEAQSKAINSMNQQLAKTLVKAPFSGTIDEVITEQGNVVSPGMPLFRLISLSDMFINVDVPETYIATIKKNTDVEVDFPVLNEKMTSKVRQAGSFINPANRSFSIEIPVDNKSGNIKPNLTAKIKINDYTSQEAILVPLNVISENQDGDQYVMTATMKEGSDNTAIASKKTIKTGKTSGDFIEVISGLSSGDLVIVEGARSVKENQEVDLKSI